MSYSILVDQSSIEYDNVYDATELTNKTRFSNIPGKSSYAGAGSAGVNMPVTFHKKVKSSGYGTAPDAMKYAGKFS